MKKVLIRFLLALFASFFGGWFFMAFGQTFTVLPYSVKPYFKAPSGTTGATAIYTTADKSVSAPGGVWVPDVYNLAGGFILETPLFIPTKDYSAPGCLFQKAGSVSVGIVSGKIKLDWISGSPDEVFGMRTLPVGQWFTIRLGLDTLGRFTASVNNILDIDRGLNFSGPIPEDNSQLVFLKGFTGRTQSIKFWANTKPDILPPGFDCFTLVKPDSLKFRFKRIDKSLIGKELTIIAENPNGAQNTLYTGSLTNQPLSFPSSSFVNGSWTFVISCGKIQHRKTVLKTVSPVLPDYFVNGLYAVNIKDFRFAKEKLKVNTVYCDFPILNNPPNYQQMSAYLDSAGKFGLKSVIRAGFQSSKGNLIYADSLERTVIARYYVDEGAGLYDGLDRNHWAKNATQPTVPGIFNLNKWRLDEASEKADILMLNIYSSGRVVYDVTRQASQLKPTWVTLPQYGNIQYGTDTMINLVGQAVCAGASGIFWFEYDHRSTAKPNDFYTPNRPELVERLRQCYALTQNVSLNFVPIQTGNPNVVACYRGAKLWIVNLSETTQAAVIAGKVVSLNALETWAQMDQSQL